MISVPIAVKNVSWQASRKTVDPAVVIAPAIDVTAHDADAPPDRQRLGRRARPHDDARGGSRGRGRVLGASRTRSPSRSHPHPYVSIKNILLRLIGQLGAF